MGKKTNVDISQAAHDAKCKISFIRETLASVDCEDFQLTENAQHGLDRILEEVEQAIDKLTGSATAKGTR